ncbi:ATP-binding protein [Wenyingzhuangia sp. chi5]|uniref:histidine kinase n=1 Tax=Wenyingzhuangia gilva TaxID=3057677 RepID=A0ABT8VQE5_9FLAO|nr:ATP-binding protein [Wenyingzhuangia sp. chi5]MDO3694192.1 ATP-binding protein [Wenyingzhuangia sp. chi5]
MSNKELSKLKKQLQLINETVSNDVYNLGEQFFEKIVLKLNKALDADYTFIGKLSENHNSVETLSLVNTKGVLENITYDLKNTPCQNVIGQNPCSYLKNIPELFPNDQLLIDMGIEAYVGVPLYDSKKEPTGILVCLFKNEIKDTYAIESILMIFASRASAELEHMKLYDALEKHKKKLESTVEYRTKELNKKNKELESSNQELAKTLESLQKAQIQLIQSEKMATLGILTSGVAHEINNPLNYLIGAQIGLSNYFENHQSLDPENTNILLESINVGVKRISNIVNGLNQFSRNNENMNEDCDIHSILNNCFEMLSSISKHKVDIIKKYSEVTILVQGNSGKLHQVFLNILSNSIQSITGHGKIEVVTKIKEREIIIEIEDNGHGIEKDILHKISDPFFTTKPPGQGTGLGLSISTSIINEHNGALKFDSEPNKGTKVTINLPLK